jgi:hypothetical protein
LQTVLQYRTRRRVDLFAVTSAAATLSVTSIATVDTATTLASVAAVSTSKGHVEALARVFASPHVRKSPRRRRTTPPAAATAVAAAFWCIYTLFVLEDTPHQNRPKIDAGDVSLLIGSIN